MKTADDMPVPDDVSGEDDPLIKLREACGRMGDVAAVDDLREWRRESESARLHRLEHPAIEPVGAVERGRALLEALGIN